MVYGIKEFKRRSGHDQYFFSVVKKSEGCLMESKKE